MLCSTTFSPARKRNASTVSLRAGTIHRALNFTNRLPLLCAALGAKKFREVNSLELLSITGPTNSTTTEFQFKLL
jgi:5-methylcytosine-specific restriction enzyme B